MFGTPAFKRRRIAVLAAVSTVSLLAATPSIASAKAGARWQGGRATQTVAPAVTSRPTPTVGGLTDSADPTAPPQLFSPDSVWNHPLSDSAPIDSSSFVKMTAFNVQVLSEIARGIGPWISSTSYSTPFYKVSADQSRVGVTLDTGSWGNTLRARLAAGVPIPDNARPARGTDGHLTVWQSSTDTLWEFWKARKAPDGWHANWGGMISDVSRSPGYYQNRSDAFGSVLEQSNWGATATSLPVVAGTVTADEARAGVIPHALAINLPGACKSHFTWPAQRTDGLSSDPTCLPEGAHLRLDPRLDLSTLKMPPFTRMLAVAAQRYGMIVRDRTGTATGLFVEDPAPYGSDVWAGTNGTNGLLGGKPWNLVRGQFPWARLQLLQMQTTSR